MDDYGSVATGTSISLMVNALNKHYEYYIRRGKFGLPLNVFDQFTQDVDPHLVECYYYGQSLPFAIKPGLLTQECWSTNKASLTSEYCDTIDACWPCSMLAWSCMFRGLVGPD